MIRRRTITSYVWNSVSGNKMVILSNCIRNFFRKFELIGNSVQGENPAPDNPQEIKSAGRFDTASGKYLIDVKVTGKNLFNLTDNYIWGWFASYQTQISLYSMNAVVYMPCKPNTTYTIYGRTNINGNNNVKNRVATANDFPAGGTKLHNITETQLSNPVTITTDELSKYLVIMAVTDNECNIDTREQVLKQNVSKMIVIIGNDPTPYEPYTEQTLTLTSDRPITKWDRLVEQGGQIGWLYGSKIYVVTGNEVFESRDGYNIESYTNRFFILNDLLKENDALKPLAYMKCLRNVQYVYSPNIFEEGFETNINQFHIKLSNDRVGILASDDHAVRTAKFSGYMKKIHKNGNPIEILYATTDTVFLPLPESVQAQLQALHSENGTTHVLVDSGEVECGINIEYKYKS